jgi:3-carboxy-cis,cis-muconate cycloisomerase
MTRIADVLVACVDSWGRIANDVAVRSRPEFGELAESEPGGSSTMPHKENPVRSILIKRAALAAPFCAAQVHAAAAAAIDERSDGAWHAEWAPLRTLARMAATAASQTADLTEGLVVHTDRMRAIAEVAAAELLAEAGRHGSVDSYLGNSDSLVDGALERAQDFLKSAQ